MAWFKSAAKIYISKIPEVNTLGPSSDLVFVLPEAGMAWAQEIRGTAGNFHSIIIWDTIYLWTSCALVKSSSRAIVLGTQRFPFSEPL